MARRLSLPAHAVLAAALVGLALGLTFFYVPDDANQGFSQRIFYIHVPIALTAYACFGWGAWKAFLHLWKRPPAADLESYVAIHQGVIFGSLVLLTGSIWARISWGVWWSWGSDQLVMFLVLFLFYATYFMLRYSIDPGPARANMSAVYALFGVALIPVSFLAIRLTNDLVHPTVFKKSGPDMSGSMFFTFCVSWAAVLLLASLLYRFELLGKRLDARLRALREELTTSSRPARATTELIGEPAVSTAEKYVTAAYLVVFVVVLAYVAIMATKLVRLQREVADLEQRVSDDG